VSSIVDGVSHAPTAKSACAWRTLTTFPSSFFQRTPVVIGATECMGRAPRNRDGPTKTHAAPATREGYRHPVDQGAFHRCDREHVKGSLLFVSRAGLPLTPPTHCPMAGDKVLSGPCKRRCRNESGSDFERAGRLYNPLVSHAWD